MELSADSFLRKSDEFDLSAGVLRKLKNEMGIDAKAY